MKIGLLTIFHVPNYGAMLQCYSLSSFLKTQGHEVFLYEVPLSNVDHLFVRMKRKIKHSFMSTFIEQYLPRYTRDLTEQADLYVIGSDQVWNPEIVGDSIDKYMFSFVPNGAKKVAYAASFGIEKWTRTDLSDNIKKLLSSFSNICIREETGVKLLKEEFGLDSTWVLDPCFLQNNFSEILGAEMLMEKNQLTTFKLVYSYQWYQDARKLSKQLGCSWVELNSRIIKQLDSIRDFNVINPSVNIWIRSIATSKYVVTDSFHGTVFCLIFKRQFVVLPSVKSRSTRLTSLLTELGLQSRIIDSVKDCEETFLQPINYDIVTPVLERMRNDSIQNLLELLKS